MSLEDQLRTPRPTHKRTGSSSRTIKQNALEYSPALLRLPDPCMVASSSTSSQSSKPSSKFISTVRRSLSVSHVTRRPTDKSAAGLEERHAPSRFRYQDPSFSPPTIEQIAMGLHLSRTPHLRPVGGPYYGRTSAQGSQHHFDPLHRTATSPPLPPPPARSSLKKPSTVASTTSSANPGLSTASSTTVASHTPSTPQSNRSVVSLRTRMTRFLPGSRSVSLPASDTAVASSDSLPRSTSEPKKAVRFS